LDGKELLSANDFAKKVELCAKASKEVSNGSFIICARTDARGVMGIEETIRRSKLYIDAGADMIFPEGLASREEFKLVAKELKAHKKDVFILANMTEFGKTPYITHKEFEEYGYNCVIYPVSTLRVAMRAVDDMLEELKQKGTLEGQLGNMQTRKDLYNTLHYVPGEEWHYPSSTKKDY